MRSLDPLAQAVLKDTHHNGKHHGKLPQQETATLVVASVAVGTIVVAFGNCGPRGNVSNPQTECDVDEHVTKKNPVSTIQVVFADKAQLGSRKASLETIPLDTFQD